LPRAANRLVGRDEDVRKVLARLTRDDVHLLTLLGLGGVGKTRLAIAAAHAVAGDLADGAQMVPLASVSRPEEVPGAIAQALTIVATPGEPPDRAVTRYLGPKHMLLVLDNLEHLLTRRRSSPSSSRAARP
jgi:predicted ATPase